MNSDLVPVVVIGSEHHNTLSIIRDLGEHNIPIIFILYGKSDEYISSSRYIKKLYRINASSDIVNILLDIAKLSNDKQVIITCSDESTSYVENNLDLIDKYYYCFNAGSKGLVTHYMDKIVQLGLARKNGFLTPEAIECYPNEKVAEWSIFPCIIKPKESIHGGKKIHVCYNTDELSHSIKKFNPSQKVSVQEYIEKDYEIVVLGVSINNEHYIPGFIKKHRDYLGGTTYCTSFPISELPENLVFSCNKMLSEINYSGLWGLECVVKGGKYFFIELNLRNDATSYVMTKSGYDLPYLFYQKSINPAYKSAESFHSVNSMVEFEDFNFVLKFKVSLLSWIKQRRGCECLYFKSVDDNAPYKRKYFSYVKGLFKRFLPF